MKFIPKEEYDKFKAELEEIRKNYPYTKTDLFFIVDVEYKYKCKYKCKDFIDNILKKDSKYCKEILDPRATILENNKSYRFNEDAKNLYLKEVEKANLERGYQIYNLQEINDVIL